MRLASVVAAGLLAGCGSSTSKGLFAALHQALGSQAIVPEVEPNGSFASAVPLTGNDAVARGNVKPIADTDYYRFSAPAFSTVFAATMTSGTSSSSVDTVLDLVASDGTTIIETDDDDGVFAGSASSIAGAALTSAGTYYLRVSSPGLLRPYDLHFHLQVQGALVEVEPNDTTAQPLPSTGFVAGTAGAGDVDLFRVAANAGDTIFASLDLDPERDGTEWNGRLSIGAMSPIDDPGNAGPDSEAAFLTARTNGIYVVRVDSAGGSSGNYRLSVSVHPATPATALCATYAGVAPVNIIDLSTVSSAATVPGTPIVADVDVALSITHPRPSDLDISLIAPGGNEVVLLTNAVGTGPIDLTFDEQAALPITVMALTPGAWQPASNYRLHWFEGQSGGGTWTLKISDHTSGSAGILNSWSLSLCERPAFICPGGRPLQTVASFDFEAGAAGWTHSGTNDSWALGTPSAAPIATCNGGTRCWKTNLTGPYNPLSSQDLKSPPIALPAVGVPQRVSWAMKYQLESDNFDHARVVIRDVGGANARVLWEWNDGTMVASVGSPLFPLQEAAGWATFSADVSEYAGRTVELVFVLDADPTNQLAGLAVDDVSFTQCQPPPCGNGALDAAEQCDEGLQNGQPSSCCSATCTFVAVGTVCRAAAGACDVAEACTGALGPCPADLKATNGTACTDGNACTVSDACQAGACVSGAAVTCTAMDQCHDVGTCSPATGLCSNPLKAPGSPCSDGDGCTVGDACQAGACAPGTPISCVAIDQCHVAGTCAPATGQCTTPAKMNGSACDDGNECTDADSCQSGACTGTPKQCVALDQCHDVGTCDAATGVCSNPVKVDGAACDDADLCTTGDICQGGACNPGASVVCTAIDGCHLAGLCDTQTGLCTNPAKGNGVGCNDSNACTRSDTCQAGVCVGANPVACPQLECHEAGACSPDSGVCASAVKSDGSACDGGTCLAGACVPNSGTGGGGGTGGSSGGAAGGTAGGAGGTGAAGGGASGGGTFARPGCGCSGSGIDAAVLWLAAMFLRRRRST